ncbi:hypothetical protein Y032_0457g1792 [Ancylostoma ceylanicum]|uniref:Uncharacterized protein n=1 Tax=Ancylostoma ceylanicum TaxID=53326 RepID=A0A016WY51_9BILA|nr:hypothetical protein Y032_0457g1792 [Ancylostoma ceylanicum]
MRSQVWFPIPDLENKAVEESICNHIFDTTRHHPQANRHTIIATVPCGKTINFDSNADTVELTYMYKRIIEAQGK